MLIAVVCVTTVCHTQPLNTTGIVVSINEGRAFYFLSITIVSKFLHTHVHVKMMRCGHFLLSSSSMFILFTCADSETQLTTTAQL